MTPEERTLLSDLFRRLREVEAQQRSQPRDAEAEDFIRRSVQDQPLSSYYMAQTVLVQQQALTAAQTRIEELERQLRERPAQPAQSGGGSFLSNALGIGRSPWGRSAEPPPAPAYPQGQPVAGRSPWGAAPDAAYPPQQYSPSPFPQPGMAPRGGGFFAGAAQTAAGVAGGMLAASAISSLLHHSPGPFGTAMAQPLAGETINETVINNYYGDDQGPQGDAGRDTARDVAYQPDPPPADDTSYDDSSFDDGGSSGGDDSWI
ncbi:hypothetical protein J2848_003107 [Azospirillum lipoferum]|uniref:DUF2076 domain-containing protein n=1 Tax=Azospirillum lipoferum TaxID=193 RepID=A0A5A9GMS4_AZOLI|nr:MULTISPECIES: DUF2076 domain-containing protein [Azospirillum]KAA0595701.1 DUF2076 domain-containing protein [Azospirillum lipoferum]MCP1611434.1 hypothetical protein [Azospirillum lipoferum]MDW5537236.1 DUF2076 domain-containing protein [Azospirillum sp. NL1]